MMDYLEKAAAELAKIRAANDRRRARAKDAREERRLDAAAAIEAAADNVSFRLAGDYMTLATLERAAAPEPDDDDAVTCPECGGLVGIFQGQAGWQHYEPGPPVRVYEADHEVTLPGPAAAGPPEGDGDGPAAPI